MAKVDLEGCLEDALENIQNDRAMALSLLTDLMQYINKEEARHREVGLTAAKYLETLQRSNDQLIKIIAILKKEQNQKEDLSLSTSEKDSIFELIKENVS